MSNHAAHAAAKHNAIAAKEASESDRLAVAVLSIDFQIDQCREPVKPIAGLMISESGTWSCMVRTTEGINGGHKNFASSYERVVLKIARLTRSFVICEGGEKFGRTRLTDCIKLS